MALYWAMIAAFLLTVVVGGLGVSIRAADVGAAAVDEPQYLLTAISLWEDRDLDVSDERAANRYRVFHEGRLPVQTSVLEDGRRVSPHDPLLPLLVAPAMAAGGFIGVKAMLVVVAGLLAAATVWVAHTRFGVAPGVAGPVAAIAGATTPLGVYAHQVYPEIVAAAAVVAVTALLVPQAGTPRPVPRTIGLVAAISVLPWLSVKYVPVAAAFAGVAAWRLSREYPSQEHLRREPSGEREPRTVYRPLVAGACIGALGVSGALWLAAHRAWYGGWTGYATGDHFESSGEFGAVGFAPNLWGRSTRLIGLLTDQDYGMLAWQPAWLLAPVALGFLVAARHPHRWVLLVPLSAGWLTAVFVALTMHGFWWPGRQIVVIAPLVVIGVAITVDRARGRWRRPVQVSAAVTAAAGVAIQFWITAAGLSGTATWVGAPDLDPPPALVAWRVLLPNYRQLSGQTWMLHAAWVLVVLALLAAGVRCARSGTRSGAPPDGRSADRGPQCSQPPGRSPGGAEIQDRDQTQHSDKLTPAPG